MPLSEFSDNLDLLDCIEMYINHHIDTNYTANNQTSFRIDGGYKKYGRFISGLIYYGGYGYSSELHDVEINRTTYERNTQEAEQIPYYFLFWIPSGYDEGVLLLQRFKQLGIMSVIRRLIVEDFHARFPSYKFLINNLVPNEVIRKIIDDGRIAKARFIYFGLPRDKAEAIGHPHEERDFSVELSINAKRNADVPITERIREFFESKRDVSNILELEGFDYNDVKLEVDFEGRSRTIDLLEFTRSRPSYDFSNEVSINEKGHPNFYELDEAAQAFAKDIGKTIGVIGDD